MSRITYAALCAGLGFVCAHADADTVVYNFPIEVAQSVPAPTIPDGFSPSGFATVTLDTDTNLLTWDITYSGLTGEIVAPGAHFHGPAGFGATAGVVVDLAGNVAGTGTGAPLPQPASGSLVGNFTISDAQESDILAGLWYVNIHTALNGPGEIRGQVIPAPASAATLALLGAAALRRRRR